MTTKTGSTSKAASGSQSGAATLTETNKEITLPTEATVDHYLSMFRSSDEDSTKTSLRFVDGFNAKPWDFRAFRHDEVAKKARRIKADGFVKITRTGGILGQAFEDWFDEESWNGDVISEGVIIDRTTRNSFPEYYWHVRPMAAKIARQQVEAEHSGKYVNVKASDKKKGQWAGEKPGIVTVDTYDAGDEQDPAGW